MNLTMIAMTFVGAFMLPTFWMKQGALEVVLLRKELTVAKERVEGLEYTLRLEKSTNAGPIKDIDRSKEAMWEKVN